MQPPEYITFKAEIEMPDGSLRNWWLCRDLKTRMLWTSPNKKEAIKSREHYLSNK